MINTDCINMALLRMRLFGDVTDSPRAISGKDIWEESEIEAVVTPYGKADCSTDSGFGSDADLSIKLPVLTPLPKKATDDVRRSLFSGKRPANHEDTECSPITPKRRRVSEFDVTSSKINTSCSSSILDAVERLTTENHLVADGSRDYTLPTIPGKHRDLKSISGDTMAAVVRGEFSEQLEKVTIVDCRYPYEFDGGHIRAATNLYTKDAVQSLLQEPVTSHKKHVLIFHCEFSSERGPKMYRFLRSQDREMNKAQYPVLNFPEVYLLHEGYKAFYENHKDLCEPIGYTPMLHEDHASDLRHFRAKSKSWTAGDKVMTGRRCRSRVSRLSLEF